LIGWHLIGWHLIGWHLIGWRLAVACRYAQTHPSKVEKLMLRGIFTLRRAELLFFYQEGANWLFPDAWEGYV
jgi:proline iminopeptidase